MQIYKNFTCALAVVLLSIGLPLGAGAAEEKVLNVYNWSDYIAEDTIKNFEERTGIKVAEIIKKMFDYTG